MRLMIAASLIALSALEAAAQPVDHSWTARVGTRVEARWTARDEDQGPFGHTEHRIALTMVWTADTAIVGTGSMAVSVRELEWSFENTEYKITASYKPEQGLTHTATPEPGDAVDEGEVRVFLAGLRDLVEGRCRILLGQGGALALRRASDQGGRPPLKIFGLLEHGPLVPRGGVVSSPSSRYFCLNVPGFLDVDGNEDLRVAVEADRERGVAFRCDADRRTRSASRSSITFVCGLRCRVSPPETTSLSCRSRVKLRRRLTPGGIRSSSLKVDTDLLSRTEGFRWSRRAWIPKTWIERERRAVRAYLKVKTLKRR